MLQQQMVVIVFLPRDRRHVQGTQSPCYRPVIPMRRRKLQQMLLILVMVRYHCCLVVIFLEEVADLTIQAERLDGL